MNLSTSTIVILAWMFIAAIIIVTRHQRQRLTITLLINVWHLLESIRRHHRIDILRTNEHQTAYDHLLHIADSIDPNLGMELIQYIEFHQWVANSSDTQN